MWVSIFLFISFIGIGLGILARTQLEKDSQSLQQKSLPSSQFTTKQSYKTGFQLGFVNGVGEAIWWLSGLQFLLVGLFIAVNAGRLSVSELILLGLIASFFGWHIPQFFPNRFAEPHQIDLLTGGFIQNQHLFFNWSTYSHFQIDHTTNKVTLFYARFPRLRAHIWQLPDTQTTLKVETILQNVLPNTSTRWAILGNSYLFPSLFYGFLFGLFSILLSTIRIPMASLMGLAIIMPFWMFLVRRKNKLIEPRKVYTPTTSYITASPADFHHPIVNDSYLKNPERKRRFFQVEFLIGGIVLVLAVFILPLLLEEYLPHWAEEYMEWAELVILALSALLTAFIRPTWKRQVDRLIASGNYQDALKTLEANRQYISDETDEFLPLRLNLLTYLGRYAEAEETAVHLINTLEPKTSNFISTENRKKEITAQAQAYYYLANLYATQQKWGKAEATIAYALSLDSKIDDARINSLTAHVLAAQGKAFISPQPLTIRETVSALHKKAETVEQLGHAIHALSYSDMPEKALPLIKQGNRLVNKKDKLKYIEWLTAVAHAYQANRQHYEYNETLGELRRIDHTDHLQRALPQLEA